MKIIIVTGLSGAGKSRCSKWTCDPHSATDPETQKQTGGFFQEHQSRHEQSGESFVPFSAQRRCDYPLQRISVFDHAYLCKL